MVDRDRKDDEGHGPAAHSHCPPATGGVGFGLRKGGAERKRATDDEPAGAINFRPGFSPAGPTIDGTFRNGAFLNHEPFELVPARPLTLRYLVRVDNRPPSSADLDAEFRAFAGSSIAAGSAPSPP